MNNLKKIFFGVTFLVLVAMTLIYSLLTHNVKMPDGGYSVVGVIKAAGFTGLPAISIILMIPAFVFGVLSLCINKTFMFFIRDLLGFFAGIFAIASAIITFFYIGGAYYIPIILCVCAIILFCLALVDLLRITKENGKEPREEEV